MVAEASVVAFLRQWGDFQFWGWLMPSIDFWPIWPFNSGVKWWLILVYMNGWFQHNNREILQICCVVESIWYWEELFCHKKGNYMALQTFPQTEPNWWCEKSSVWTPCQYRWTKALALSRDEPIGAVLLWLYSFWYCSSLLVNTNGQRRWIHPETN